MTKMDSRFHGNDTTLDRFLEKPNYECNELGSSVTAKPLAKLPNF